MPERTQHRARKRFGQNFLVDVSIIERIVNAVNVRDTDAVIEIGPGQGALTDHLADHCAHLDVIEIDRDLAAEFRWRYNNRDNFKLHNQDVLKFDFHSLPPVSGGYRLIGNLPYNISTPLLFHLFESRELFRDMLFMLQLEVVDRMTAEPGGKNYGRLGIMTQYYSRVEKLFRVPSIAFSPQPKVESAIVRLVPYIELPCPARDTAMLEKVVRTAFSQRRKTVQNSLNTLTDKDMLSSLGIDGSRRPETLTLEEYVNISDLLVKAR